MLPLLFLLLLIGFASAELDVTCPSDSITSKDGSACYRYYPIPLNYFKAQSVCAVHEGAVLEDTDALNFIIEERGAIRIAHWLMAEPTNQSKCVAYDLSDNSTKPADCQQNQLPFACKFLPTKDASQRCLLWTQPAGMGYRFHSVPLTWQEARDRCIEEGGDLATISTREENEFINKAIGYFPSWIGANKMDSFKWINGKTLETNNHYCDYSNFCAWHDYINIDEPDTCLTIFLQKWAPMKCNLKLPYVCKKTL